MFLPWNITSSTSFLNHEAVTSVLIGASKPSQILDNIKAAENTSFTTEELAKIEEISV